ncbi:hypothetical protein ACGFNX_22635 [Streptomyces sp. NPDC048723]|uniref:hypothetical protein n=1 Tax=Streptomyces sp. NPDC048723 TaxID=3365589 RepID=UPI003717B4A9
MTALRARTGLYLAAASVLLSAGCGTHQERTTGAPGPAASAPATGPSTALSDLARLESALANQAGASGSAPTDSGLSLAPHVGNSASYLWETSEGKVCFAQGAVSGAVVHETACLDAAQTTVEEPGSRLDTFFGPGDGFSEPYIVFAAAPGSAVTSVKYETRDTSWTLVRKLDPRATGRDVYYVTLPDGHKGWIDVTLEQSDGAKVADRLPITMGKTPQVY